jgi:hypothetical protein
MSPAPKSLPASEGFEISLVGGAEDLLRGWDAGFRALLTSPGVTAATRAELQAGQRIAAELAATLRQPGKPWLLAARLRGAVQCVASLQFARRALFIAYLVSAPCNLVPGDPRAVRGACSALIEHAVALSTAAGLHGRLSLEADNPQCRQVYFHLGFRRAAGEAEAGELVPQQALATEADLMLLEPAISLGWRKRSLRRNRPASSSRSGGERPTLAP